MKVKDRVKYYNGLPKRGNVERMNNVKALKTTLGFSQAQCNSLHVTYNAENDLFALDNDEGNTSTNVNFSDASVKCWAELINEQSVLGNISAEDAPFYSEIVAEAKRIEQAEEAQAVIDENLAAVQRARQAAAICNGIADACLEAAKELGYEP